MPRDRYAALRELNDDPDDRDYDSGWPSGAGRSGTGWPEPGDSGSGKGWSGPGDGESGGGWSGSGGGRPGGGWSDAADGRSGTGRGYAEPGGRRRRGESSGDVGYRARRARPDDDDDGEHTRW